MINQRIFQNDLTYTELLNMYLDLEEALIITNSDIESPILKKSLLNNLNKQIESIKLKIVYRCHVVNALDNLINVGNH